MRPPIPIPDSLDERLQGWSRAVAWSYFPGASVWRLTRPAGETRYLKLRDGSWDITLAAERDRLVWAADHLPVPPVIDYGRTPEIEWLMTEALPGRDATHPDLKRDPEALVPLLAEGLRMIHSVDAETCPFDFRLRRFDRPVAESSTA